MTRDDAMQDDNGAVLVAQAIYDELERQDRDNGQPGMPKQNDRGLYAVGVYGHVDLISLARAALLAIREPTEAMSDAAVSVRLNEYGLDEHIRDIAPEVWRAMIDKALEE